MHIRETFRRRKKLCVGLIFVVFFLVILMAAAPKGGEISGQTPAKTAGAASLITTSTTQMLPTINDMPDGSYAAAGVQEQTTTVGISGNTNVNATQTSTMFIVPKTYGSLTVLYTAYKFTSITDATNYYDYTKSVSSVSSKVTSIGVGDEGFGYTGMSGGVVVFRKANVVINVLVTGSAATTATALNEAKSYANLVKI